ncbi:uncharacterized protein QC761_117675 [Podospora bellae-mahoneyi]|uniref:Uncharacterized protein n=1 Tax=Podospora bellae-mahoneyi TaxID=2093777 RepID=A0ABR0G0S0_9PEZI|nr:hypothetical protein QC761_117675 [Podospora bellae-mahoneyi]
MSAPATNRSAEGINALEFLTKRQAVRGDWTCQFFFDGPGHDALRADHAAFNRLFGSPRLTARGGQCYVGRCNGRDFAWCNIASNTRSEYSNQRNLVADTNPYSGINCVYDYMPAYEYYWWGWEGALRFDNSDIRRC